MKHNNCYGKGTLFLRASGDPVAACDLRPGDLILSTDSSTVEIQSVTHIQKETAYKVVPKIGNVVYMGAHTTLTLVGMCGSARGSIVDMTVSEYTQLQVANRTLYNWFKQPVRWFHRLDSVETETVVPIDVALMKLIMPLDLETHAYLYGLLLATGVTKDKRAFAVSVFRHTKLQQSLDVDEQFLDRFIADIDQIRPNIIFGVKSVRAEFLAGALDASSYNRTTKRFDVHAVSQQACDDLLFAAMSLGYYCSHIVNLRYDFTCRQIVRSYTVYVYPNTNSCMPSRVFDVMPIKVQFNGLFSSDFAIEPVGETDMCQIKTTSTSPTRVFFADFSVTTLN